MATVIKNMIPEPVVKDSQKHLKTVALRAYKGQKKPLIDDQQIAKLMPMVAKIVQRVVSYLKPPLSFEDLVSAGAIGLVKAAKDFDPSYNAEFKTYAYIRIKGAILDELRSFSLLPTNQNKQINKATHMARKIVEKTGAPPTDAELAEKLGITLEQLHKTFEHARAKQFLSIDNNKPYEPSLSNILVSPATAPPDKQMEFSELVDKLTEAIQMLPAKQRQIIILYYQKSLTMKQVAEVLEITESRVSQLHANAIFNLSIKLREWKNA
ncbi:MAG: sigma-70 family RNA polymerase sigma factor [Planctomycetota bacterium]|jgi:RNA polymerase sigma factor for flagellar operon FliA